MHNFKRNLTYEELCDEIENVIEKEGLQSDKPYLFSAMGIGEPLLNYDNLIKLFHYLNNKYPGSKFALATTGVSLNNILKLADDLKDIEKFKLTISLHSADNKVRESLMPIKQNIDELVGVVKKYKEISGREVEWNYVLFDGINDSLEAARKLFNLLGKDEYIKINKFNKVSISEIKESKNTKDFMDELKRVGMNAEFYETNGSDINAACGQMIAE